MRYRILIIVLSGLAVCHCNRNELKSSNVRFVSPHSLSSELMAFYDISRLPLYLDSTICGQSSTYDTTGGNDDGFSGKYSFIRKNKGGGLVLFDLTGSGVINRIWTPTPNEDTLDFYIDDTLKPAFSICYMDLFSGKQYPFTAPLCGNQLGGFYCYLPIPFSKCCRIVTRGNLEQFHQIGYRLYEKGAVVKPFSICVSDDEKKELERIKSLWEKEDKGVSDFFKGQIRSRDLQVSVRPGKSVTIFKTSNGGRILGMELNPASTLAGLQKEIDIRVTWDDEKIPAVLCPAADFFGFGFGEPAMKSLLLGTRNNKAYCYFPMPFDRSARIELINRSGADNHSDPVNLKAQIWYSDKKRDPAVEGKFYVSWKNELPTIPGHQHMIADVHGKGHYIGTLLQAQGLKAGMTIFFEGDDSTSIDGHFSMHGTGSEDYFNGGWYAMMDRWDDMMSLPLHGCLGYSLPFCRTGGYRLYLSDKMSFEKSLYLGIEHGPEGNMVPSAYTSLGLYYCDTRCASAEVPSNKMTAVYIPDTLFIYPQLTDFTIYGKINIATTWKYGTGGESYHLTPGDDSWIRMSLRDIPEGKYSLFLDIVKSPDGCEFSVWHRQKRISDWMPSYSQNELREMYLFACDYMVPDANKTLTIRFKTNKEKNSLMLNRIVLIRKK